MQQVDFLLHPEFEAEFYLTQVVSHHSIREVERFLAEARRRGVACPGAFGVFLLSQFFRAIPKELEEAAMLDGCRPWRIYWNIMLPLSTPALATLAILVFIGSWNDFLGPLVFLESVERFTLPVGGALV